jgi:uncharacterized protein YjbI with pentapeptide repeats
MAASPPDAPHAGDDGVFAHRAADVYRHGVEQLAHPSPIVRLGGLSALEQLGRLVPGYRQPTIDVVCGYLRLPPMAVAMAVEAPGVPDRPPAARRDAGPEEGPGAEHGTERNANAATDRDTEVRRAAQRLLARHLTVPITLSPGWHTRPRDRGHEPEIPPAEFWSGMRVDLCGAVLHDLDLSHARIGDADFRKARFGGRASFLWADLEGDARFDDARFDAGHGDGGHGDGGHGDPEQGATFGGAVFHGHAVFERTRFAGHADFEDARFAGTARFHGARFADLAQFNRARFDGTAHVSARFDAHAGFHLARFGEAAYFDEARFLGHRAMFREAEFHGYAEFGAAGFRGKADFRGAKFIRGAGFDDLALGGEFDFTGAMAGGRDEEDPYGADEDGHWPPPWTRGVPIGGDSISPIIRL